MKVSVSQFKSTSSHVANLETASRHIEIAAGDGARVVAFPEASSFDFESTRDELRAHAENDSDSFLTQLGETAARFGVDVFVGVYEPNGGPRSSNVFVHLGKDGNVLGRYEKVHLYDAFSFKESEKNRHAPLTKEHGEVYVAEIDGIKFAVLNCYDLRFPEISRIAVDKGADVLIYGAGWIAGSLKELHWQTLLQARAIENTCYVMASCQPPPVSVGMSMILDPSGMPLAGVAGPEGVCTASVELARLEEYRKVLPCLAHRRYRIAENRPEKNNYFQVEHEKD